MLNILLNQSSNQDLYPNSSVCPLHADDHPLQATAGTSYAGQRLRWHRGRELNALPLGVYGASYGSLGSCESYGSYGSTHTHSGTSSGGSSSFLLAAVSSTRQAEHRGKGKYIL